jgi:hypothetical protein
MIMEKKSVYKSVYNLVLWAKRLEREEIVKAIKKYGNKVEDGFEIEFDNDKPMIAVYINDMPIDAIISAVKVDEDDYVTLLGRSNDGWDESIINAEDVFAGQLEFVTDIIYSNYSN